MTAVTLSSKYQLAIPKAIRDELGLYAGQKLALITEGSVIELVPLRSIEKSRGLLKRANPERYRDRRDRY